jgi:sugar phosphate isomerase/epimerase
VTERFSALAASWVRFPGGDEDVSEPTPAWPLEEVLDAVAAAGFGAVGLDHYTTAAHGRVDELGAMLSARGLRCTDVGVLPVGEPGVAEAAEQLARTASATGAKLCIAAFYGPAADPVGDLRAAADVLSEAGVRLALEFTAYGDLRTLARASELCEAVGWDRCGLLVDTWHFFRSGAPWPLLRSLRGDRVALVHVNDGAPASGIDPVFEGRFRRLPPGAGAFAIDRFAEAIDATGYDGPISVEVLSTELRRRAPEEVARILHRSLARSRWSALDRRRHP